MGVLEYLKAHGPTRVLVNKEGKALPMYRVVKQNAFEETMPRIVFVRGDGWTLGAPKGLEEVAHALWAKDWVGWTDRACQELRPMSDEGWRT